MTTHKVQPEVLGDVFKNGDAEIDYTQSMSQDMDGIITSTLVYQGPYFKVSKIARTETKHPEFDYLYATNWGSQRLKGNLGRATVTYKGVGKNKTYTRYRVKSSARSEPIETHPHFIIGKDISKTATEIQNEKAYGHRFGLEIVAGEPKGSMQAFYDTVDTNRAFKLFPKAAKFDLGGITNFLQLGMVVQAVIVTNAKDGFGTAIKGGAQDGGFAYNVGQIADLPSFIDINPKSNISMAPNKYSWLVTACNIEIIGGAMRQEVDFTLSGPKGWNRLVYKTSTISSNLTDSRGD